MQTFNTQTLKWHIVDNGRHHIKLQPNQEMVCPDSYPVSTDDPVIAEVLTPWASEEQMQLDVDHAPFVIDDAAEQQPIPNPNIGSALIETGAANLAEIEADNNFGVLWSESE